MSANDDNARTLPPSLWRRLYVVLVCVFVVWHLFVMFVRNCKIEAAWLDASAGKYEKLLYVDQTWSMFTSPLWKRSPFLAGRVHLSDGTTADILTDNEPANVARFFRWGGFRQRKLEHQVSRGTKGKYLDPISQRYAEHFAARWRAAHPDDARKVERVTLLERSYAIPEPGDPWEAQPQPTVNEIATYEVEAKRRP